MTQDTLKNDFIKQQCNSADTQCYEADVDSGIIMPLPWQPAHGTQLATIIATWDYGLRLWTMVWLLNNDVIKCVFPHTEWKTCLSGNFLNAYGLSGVQKMNDVC